MNFWTKISVTLAVGLLFTLANYSVSLHRENVRLNGVVQLAEMRSDVNNEMANELLSARINDVYKLTEEQLISQGKLLGVVSYLNGDNQEFIDELWHEGYMRGLSQNEYEYEVISKNEYQKGYNQAKKDGLFDFAGEDGAINISPRDVVSGSIGKPEFDKKNGGLLGNEQLIGELNKKIEELNTISE